MNSKELVRQAILSVPPERVYAGGGAVPHLVWGPNCSEKKIKNAIASYAWTAKPDDVVAMEDSTTFGSGKKGILITSEGLYSSEPGWPRGLHFKDLDHMEVLEGYILKFCYLDGRYWPLLASYKYNIWMCEVINAVLCAMGRPLPEAAAVKSSPQQAVRRSAPERDLDWELESELAELEEWENQGSAPAPAAKPDTKETALQEAMSLYAAGDYDAALPDRKSTRLNSSHE